MSIKEYADSMNCTVQEILNKCRELGIKASDKDSFLEDDDIIVLDNAINIISTNTESTFEDNDALDEAVENILGEEINSKPIIKKEKLKKKTKKIGVVTIIKKVIILVVKIMII